jgi:hypothetical protein
MQNYKKNPIDFNCDDIFDALQKYPRPNNNSVDVNVCSNEEINKVASILNLPIASILYFRIGTSFNGHIHKDENLNNSNPSLIKHALNFPLYNCNDVYMRWYTQIDPTINEKPFLGPRNGTLTPLLNYNNAICIDEVNCNQVNLVNILDWHSIENRSTTECGYLISVRFEYYINTSFDKPLHEWLER